MVVNLEFLGKKHPIQVLKIEEWRLSDFSSSLAIAGVESGTDDFYLPQWAGIVVPFLGKPSQVARLIEMIENNDGVDSQEQFDEFVRLVGKTETA